MTYLKEMTTHKEIIAEMEKFMPYAWDKALGHRGISAGCNHEILIGILERLGDTELLEFALDNKNYAMYGVPVLKAICEKYGFAIPDDYRVEKFSKGLPCWESCPDCVGR